MPAARARRAPPRAALRPLDVDTLWSLARCGAPSLAPDGHAAVLAVSTPSVADNRSTSELWLLPTDRCAPRRLTSTGGKDGQPAWSPRGDRIAFIARREQDGRRDSSPQLYAIAPDGGEAERLTDFGPGIESFRWMPDGKRIVFAAWVWPELRGTAAQLKRHREVSERKTSGYATSEAYYRYWDHNLPEGRALHLHLLDTRTGRIRDLFEGLGMELPRDAVGAEAYAPHPGGGRIAFVHDPAEVPLNDNRCAISELDLGRRTLTVLLDDTAWDFSGPAWSPGGEHLACRAAHVGRAHTASAQLALRMGNGTWRALDLHGEHVDLALTSPPAWTADGSGIRFTAEEHGRCHLWRHDLASGATAVEQRGGWVQGFDAADDVLVWSADAAAHPVRVHASRGAGGATQRLERFNDEALGGVAFGEVRPHTVKGALGEPIQMWLTFPPGFDAMQRHPVMHVIHGGPFAASGDTFSYRWNPHVFAAPGHVIAQVNYHGSSGFGWAFRHSLIGRQGGLELQDIEAATDWLRRQRWADPQRFTATGGSYGGFLVAWMNGHVKPGRYQAYVCHAGVFDRVATYSADSYASRPKDLQAWYWQGPDAMARVLSQSPHAFAAAMRTPTLVIHGAQDFRVPDCNGLAYYNTLKALGVPARLLWFPDENHWVLKPANARQWTREFLAWIAGHTADQPTLSPSKRRASRRTA